MPRQAIFLSDEKPQDLEGYSDFPKDSRGREPSPQSPSTPCSLRVSASLFKKLVKWALICTLTVLALILTLNIFEPQSSKVRRSLR